MDSTSFRAMLLLLAVILLVAGGNAAPKTLMGSYPHLLKSSVANLTSDNDVAASVELAKRTQQTLIGTFIDECFYYETLRPLLEETADTGISVFGMLRSHNGAIYCPTVWGNATAGTEVDWTHVATSLAKLSVEFPHFVGFTIDDFYCMMVDPMVPEAKGMLPVSAMADAHGAMKKIAPNFKFMPTVYPNFLGVYAGASGYTLGVSAGLPFDTDTSASLSLAPADAGSGAHSSSGGSLSFWLSSAFSTWDRNGLASDPVWRGKLFVRAALQTFDGKNLTLMDMDVFSLTGCTTEVGTEVVLACIPQQMLLVNATIPKLSAGWACLTIEVYARDAVNMNYYNSKLVSIWELSLILDGVEVVGTKKLAPVSFRVVDSPAKFQPHGAPKNASVSNVGKVQAHNNSEYTIASACDGLLFPFAENAQSVYTSTSYKALLSMTQASTQGKGQSLWALHYGWMWKGAFGPGVHQVDPHFLKQMIQWDQAAGVDAVVLWGLPAEAARIASQEGIFSERQPPPSVVASAKQEGWQRVLQAWYPGYCNGYGGWHQTWTSRMPIQGNSTAIGVARDCCGHATGGPGEWFFAVLIRVDGGPILYNASSGASSCREPLENAPCPGMDMQEAAALGINCTVSCSPASTLAFKERVEIHVPPTDRLIHLALEMAELRGVGNWDSGVQFAVGASSGTDSQYEQSFDTKGTVETDWVYEAGLYDPSILPIFDAAIQGFVGQ